MSLFMNSVYETVLMLDPLATVASLPWLQEVLALADTDDPLSPAQVQMVVDYFDWTKASASLFEAVYRGKNTSFYVRTTSPEAIMLMQPALVRLCDKCSALKLPVQGCEALSTALDAISFRTMGMNQQEEVALNISTTTSPVARVMTRIVEEAIETDTADALVYMCVDKLWIHQHVGGEESFNATHALAMKALASVSVDGPPSTTRWDIVKGLLRNLSMSEDRVRGSSLAQVQKLFRMYWAAAETAAVKCPPYVTCCEPLLDIFNGVGAVVLPWLPVPVEHLFAHTKLVFASVEATKMLELLCAGMNATVGAMGPALRSTCVDALLELEASVAAAGPGVKPKTDLLSVSRLVPVRAAFAPDVAARIVEVLVWRVVDGRFRTGYLLASLVAWSPLVDNLEAKTMVAWRNKYHADLSKRYTYMGSRGERKFRVAFRFRALSLKLAFGKVRGRPDVPAQEIRLVASNP
jgi:hypothetical protein